MSSVSINSDSGVNIGVDSVANAVDFAARLDAYLKARSLSQPAFAKLVDDYDSNINAILKRKRAPTPERMATWAAVLKLDDHQAAELRALAEAAQLQRRLDREGKGHRAHVVEYEPGKFSVATITGQGRELVLVGHTPTIEQQLRDRIIELEAENADLHARLDRIAREAEAPSGGVRIDPTVPPGPGFKRTRKRFVPDPATIPEVQP